MSARVKVEIRQLPHGEGLALPAYQSAHAAGLDLLAAVPEDAPMVLAPGKYALVPTGLTIALPPGYEAQVRPRSGLAAKHGVTVLNSPGTVDADYRGEIGVLLINHGDAPFPIRRGERIAQMVIAAVVDGGAGSRGGAFGDRPRHRRFRFDRPLAIPQNSGPSFHTKSMSDKVHLAHFFAMRFAFTIWTLTRWSPVGDIVVRFANGGLKRAGRKVVRFGANHVGRDRGDASDPAVVHFTGTQRPDRPWHGGTAAGQRRPMPPNCRSCSRSRPGSISITRNS